MHPASGYHEVMIRLDRKNARARDLADFLCAARVEAELPEDICLVLGGDGTMLRAIRELGPAFLFLGLNCGRVGFLLNEYEEPSVVLRRLVDREWSSLPFPRLRLSAWGPPHETAIAPGGVGEAAPDRRPPLTGFAVNDVYVERMTAQSSNLRVHIDGALVVERLACDGLVVSTSLGSTGYALAAGGPACHPRLRGMLITPICAHRPRLGPLLVPQDARVEVVPVDAHRRPVRAVADGVDFHAVTRLLVEDARSDVRLAFFNDHDFTSTMFRKVLLG
jgi:NAD+ kinase